MKLLIRKPEISEAQALAKVHVQSWQETYAGILPKAYLDGLRWQHREPMWQSATPNPDRHVVAAFDGEDAVAISLSGPTTKFDRNIASAQLYVIYVLRSHQRLGLGRSLLAEAAGYWHDRGGDKLGLLVITANLGACSFYEALGGHAVITQKCTIADTPLEETLYVFDNLTHLSSS